MEETFRFALCDDEFFFAEELKKRIENAAEKRKRCIRVESFTGSKAVEALLEGGQSFDVYFLDIDMPRLDGISLGGRIRELDGDAVIIFVSGKEEMVFDSFRVNPLQFVRKRYLEKDFPIVMEALWRELERREKEQGFMLEVGQVQYRLDVRKVMYIEATGKYLNIYLTDRMYYIRYQISALEEQLQEYGFLRIHKSYLVNIRYIYLIETGHIVLENQQSLPVSRQRFHEVQERFRQYMIENV